MAVIFFDNASAPDADKITFTEGSFVSNSGILMSTEFQIRRHIPAGENPSKGSLGTYQETGPARITGTITGIIDNAGTSTHAVRAKLRSFALRDQSDDDHPYGLVGFTLDRFSEWNCTPDKDGGFVIEDFMVKRGEDRPYPVYFSLMVRRLGAVGSAPGFDWG